VDKVNETKIAKVFNAPLPCWPDPRLPIGIVTWLRRAEQFVLAEISDSIFFVSMTK